jgi:thioredoxin reductase
MQDRREPGGSVEVSVFSVPDMKCRHCVRASARLDGTTKTLTARALFVLIGGEPRTDWLPPEIERCPRGYVMTGADLPGGERLVLETCVPGIFAAGDVRHRSVKRVASAAGEGAMVIALVHEHLARTAPDLVTA